MTAKQQEEEAGDAAEHDGGDVLVGVVDEISSATCKLAEASHVVVVVVDSESNCELFSDNQFRASSCVDVASSK
jgi:hypothetical protein